MVWIYQNWLIIEGRLNKGSFQELKKGDQFIGKIDNIVKTKIVSGKLIIKILKKMLKHTVYIMLWSKNL